MSIGFNSNFNIPSSIPTNPATATPSPSTGEIVQPQTPASTGPSGSVQQSVAQGRLTGSALQQAWSGKRKLGDARAKFPKNGSALTHALANSIFDSDLAADAHFLLSQDPSLGKTKLNDVSDWSLEQELNAFKSFQKPGFGFAAAAA